MKGRGRRNDVDKRGRMKKRRGEMRLPMKRKEGKQFQEVVIVKNKERPSGRRKDRGVERALISAKASRWKLVGPKLTMRMSTLV